ncbi:Della protein gai1 [Thalictrum thalictroides]|uniref:DELLA protein n=1 Tax=Thalictrum thalictroides TaxID=46969 RepID=A0A7J6W9A5_THATH|nr:Della protein gai1 [Thalictrum thalictroides]
MKRTHHHQENGGYSGEASYSMENTTGNGLDLGKAEMMCWEEDNFLEQQQDTGEDELLAVVGYNVKNVDLADVAQKMEQLEMMMNSSVHQEDGFLSDAVHYNPSNMSSWLESMLSEAELTLPPNFDTSCLAAAGLINYNEPFQSSSSIDDNLFIVPPTAESSTTINFPNPINPQIYNTGGDEEEEQQLNPPISDYDLSVIPVNEPIRPVVLIDSSQENGIRLVHTLMACAEAIQQDNPKLAESLVKQISLLAVSQAGAMKKVATYFAEALARRVYGLYPQPSYDSSFSDILQIHFYETCPHLKFAHFTANQAILDSLVDSNRVHIIDFSMKQGIQWPALMQALAMRPNGPPKFRLTGVGPPQPDNTDALQQVGWKLAQFAENLHIEFEYRGFVANSLADLDSAMFDIRPNETVVVNSVFELHQLLAIPGAIEKVLRSIKEMKPKIVTIVEQEANHNGPIFLDRFTEALHYYSTLFDSLEGYGYSLSPLNGQDLIMSEMYFGRQICNVVACEGVDRVERHECLDQWRNRMKSAGFSLSHLGSNTFRQVNSLLSVFDGGSGYKVEENNGCLLLGWHTRPLVASSAWQICDSNIKSEVN